MKPKLYNRQEQVTREVAAIKKSMIDIVDSSILFWYGKHETHAATGNAHGRLAAGQVLSSLDVIKEKMQGV